MDITRIRIQKEVLSGSLAVGIFSVANDGKCSQGAVSFAQAEAGAEMESTLTLSPDDGQQLLDDLWAAGIRPSHKPEPLALLKAKDEHISHLFDLAKLALSKQ